MRKIISIVLTLGVILGLTAFAAPVAAAPCVCPTAMSTFDIVDGAGPPDFCAGGASDYDLGFVTPITLPITLIAGADSLSVDFPADTDLSNVLFTDVFIDGAGLDSAASLTITNQHLEAVIPVALWGFMNLGTPHDITVNGVVNPTVADTYCLYIDYVESCAPGNCAAVQFACATYTVIPAVSTYDFLWDSEPTYPGIAQGFVPPFKACGQAGFPGIPIPGYPGKWANFFDLLLHPTLIGCLAPCTANVTVTMNLTAAPAGSNVTISFNGTVISLVPTTLVPQPQVLVGNWTLTNNTTLNWTNAIHFDTVGSYQICFNATCPAGARSCFTVPPCVSGPTEVAYKCFDIEVYQWKDALKIPLYRKWNLISLPLVPLFPDQPIADQLAALPNASTLIKSVHHYDQCVDEWLVYGNGQTSLATMVDGVSYWVKVDYSLSDPTKAPGLPVGVLWVFGTPKPVPPDSPSAYAVCEGWNMVGITGYDFVNWILDDAYLWNWKIAPIPTYEYGAIYGWDPANLWVGTQMWYSLNPPGGWALPWNFTGEGYWIPFAHDGMIYPP